MRRFLLVLFSLAISSAAMAQEFFNAYHVPAYALNASANVHSGYMLRSALFPKRHDPVPGRGGAGRRARDAEPGTAFRPTLAPGATVRGMAALVPAGHRTQALARLQQALSDYKKVESALGLPKNDVASGLSAFIAGNYIAYHGASVPDAAYRNLVRQMRTVLISNPAFAKTTDAQKQALYERLASIGMYMAAEQHLLSKNPDAASALEMRKASRQAFESFFKMDIERIKITGQGVVEAGGVAR